MIFYNSECSIRDYKTILLSIVLSQQFVKHSSTLLQQLSRYESWLPNITEIATPLILLAGSELARQGILCSAEVFWEVANIIII